MATSPKILSLFSGVGMLDEAVRLVFPDARTICHVEREAYAVAVLANRMEDEALDDCPIWSDLGTFDGKPWRGVVDIITASPPCQPYSCAGKRMGNSDSRSHGEDGQGPLVHTIRIIDEVRPALVFFENVPPWVRAGHFRSFGEQLCGLGYDILEPVFLSAGSVGASHKRERVFILAYRTGGRTRTEELSGQRGSSQSEGIGMANGNRWELWNDRDQIQSAQRKTATRGSKKLAIPPERGQRELREPSKGDGLADGNAEELGNAEHSIWRPEQQTEGARQRRRGLGRTGDDMAQPIGQRIGGRDIGRPDAQGGQAGQLQDGASAANESGNGVEAVAESTGIRLQGGGA